MLIPFVVWNNLNRYSFSIRVFNILDSVEWNVLPSDVIGIEMNNIERFAVNEFFAELKKWYHNSIEYDDKGKIKKFPDFKKLHWIDLTYIKEIEKLTSKTTNEDLNKRDFETIKKFGTKQIGYSSNNEKYHNKIQDLFDKAKG